MKNLLGIVLIVASLSSRAQALTVSGPSIASKTALIAVADVSVNGTMQTVLTDNIGFTLYTFAVDTNGVSNCSGGCLTVWPPMHVPAGTSVLAPFATIQGNDGQVQLTLNGLPLYHFHSDAKPGDAFGQYPQWSTVVVTP